MRRQSEQPAQQARETSTTARYAVSLFHAYFNPFYIPTPTPPPRRRQKPIPCPRLSDTSYSTTIFVTLVAGPHFRPFQANAVSPFVRDSNTNRRGPSSPPSRKPRQRRIEVRNQPPCRRQLAPRASQRIPMHWHRSYWANSAEVHPPFRYRQAWLGPFPRMSASASQSAFRIRWAASMGNSLTGLTSA